MDQLSSASMAFHLNQLCTLGLRKTYVERPVAHAEGRLINLWRDIEGRGENCEGRPARGDQRGENCEGRPARGDQRGENCEGRTARGDQRARGH